jgi:putative iron-regulated protein
MNRSGFSVNKTFYVGLLAAFILGGCNKAANVSSSKPTETANKVQATAAVSGKDVVVHYADIAAATFEDSLLSAQDLQKSIDALIASPNEESLKAAKDSWKNARVYYQQSEAFRFGNPVVDAWEGQLNAWPLDEGLIDYVDTQYYQHVMGNVGATANIIANPQLSIGVEVKDLSKITPQLLADLNEIGGSEANVATGYHAIEFLLWGQDLNGSSAGAGNRPATDFQAGAGCTGGNCERRVQYLQALTALLVSDLEYMVAQWAPAGEYRQQLLAEQPEQGMRRMFFGMGSLSLGELAGERMKVALEANSVEDEHDCFSDNTHASHFYDAKGIKNVYTGKYQRRDGSVLSGASLSAYVQARDAEADAALLAALDETEASLGAMVASAESVENPMTFDMMIAEGNEKGRALITAAIASLVTQTGYIEKAANAAGIVDLNPETADHSF